jgi:hypothetical protein
VAGCAQIMAFGTIAPLGCIAVHLQHCPFPFLPNS